ncbi:hypothetical protein O3G_MSEX011505 [Manduca sexta]|uniref:Uncharacterized protein n=2 Tax=Manduca sexta TaxID=7130 RepID=A0A921ZMN2_MANSE|nr:hypothetical protein O3G_MSEX011505 [Manduca sexta]
MCHVLTHSGQCCAVECGHCAGSALLSIKGSRCAVDGILRAILPRCTTTTMKSFVCFLTLAVLLAVASAGYVNSGWSSPYSGWYNRPA